MPLFDAYDASVTVGAIEGVVASRAVKLLSCAFCPQVLSHVREIASHGLIAFEGAAINHEALAYPAVGPTLAVGYHLGTAFAPKIYNIELVPQISIHG